MPSLELFGQKTCFAGDDLRTFCLVALAFRTLQLCLSISVLSLTARQHGLDTQEDIEDLEECEDGGFFSPLAADRGLAILFSYAILGIVLALASIVININMYQVSGKGTPTITEPRKSMPFICYINLTVLNVLRASTFLFGVLATVVLVEYCNCLDEKIQRDDQGRGYLREACPNSQAWVGAMVTLNIMMSIDFFFAAGVCACFGFHWVSPTLSVLLPSETRWKLFCRCCFGLCSTMTCCVFGGAQAFRGDFGDFALALSNLLNSNGTIDVTPSDVVTGLTMMRRIQRAEILETREHLQKATRKSSNITDDSGPSQRIVPSTQAEPSGETTESGGLLAKAASQSIVPTTETKPSAETTEGGGLLVEGTREGDEKRHDDSKKKFKVLSPKNEKDSFCMAEAARFMPYAEGAYTWVMYIMEYPFTALCRLAFLALKQCACLKSSQGRVSGDRFLRSHTIALKEIAGLHDEDIVYASFKQGIEATPYLIALDHEWKTVVLAIRGTLSFESLLADITLKSVELKLLGEELGFDGERQYCHSGMLACSEWIYRDLERHGKLNELFKGQFSGYKLRVVGHSLGAACAAVLSIFLRPRYPTLRCLAFSPPGCVLSKDLAEGCSNWTTSYVLDSDIVPRLSIESFEAMRDELLETICRIKIPKYQVSQPTRQELKSRSSLIEVNTKVLCDPEEPHDSDFKRQVDEFREFQAKLKAEQQSTFVRLYPPGEIIQLFRTWDKASFRIFTSDDSSHGKPTEYTAHWIDKRDLETIVLSSHLLFDHDPVQVKMKLQDAAGGFALAPPYSSVLRSATSD